LPNAGLFSAGPINRRKHVRILCTRQDVNDTIRRILSAVSRRSVPPTRPIRHLSPPHRWPF